MADPERFDADADPDPTFQAEADPDPAPAPDPNPFIRVKKFFFKSSTMYCFQSLPKLVVAVPEPNDSKIGFFT